MLSSITVRNFGCFDDEDYTVNFNKLNVIVGTNNSGKSTLFKGLNFIRFFALTKSFQWNTPYYQLQDFKESVYGHQNSRTVKIQTGYENGLKGELLLSEQKIDGKFFENDRHKANIHYDEHKEVLKKIWYFSPNRNPITFRENVSEHGDQLQPLRPDGLDIKQYLIERWTSQDHNWSEAQNWFKKIDPQLSLFKTPLYGNQVSLETERNDGNLTSSVNVSLQGDGMQNAITIISGIIFSPEGSTIIIEEPENYLNSRSKEVLVDVFNYAVNNLNKQIIITTHSWEIINAYCSDIGEGTTRGNNHNIAKAEDFKLIVVNEKLGSDKIQEFDLSGKKYTDVRNYFKELWG